MSGLVLSKNKKAFHDEVDVIFCHHLPTLRGSDLSQLKSVSAIKNFMQIFTTKNIVRPKHATAEVLPWWAR